MFDPDNTDVLAEAAQNGLHSIDWTQSTETPPDVLFELIDFPDGAPSGSGQELTDDFLPLSDEIHRPAPWPNP